MLLLRRVRRPRLPLARLADCGALPNSAVRDRLCVATAATASFASSASGDISSFKVCVVGAGPSGLYCVDRLLKLFPQGAQTALESCDDGSPGEVQPTKRRQAASEGVKLQVDVIDRLPTPFGLVRSGVAPDHHPTKAVTNKFQGLLDDPRTQFFGNVRLGSDVSVGELRRWYHAIILAYGTEGDKSLGGLPGEEDLRNILSARDFVWWYNGHPDLRDLQLDLSRVKQVAIFGQGNVALDCARILLRDVATLAETDIAQHALDELSRSAVETVYLVGRRGPAQMAATPKELRELLFGIPNVASRIVSMADDEPAAIMELTARDLEEIKSSRVRRRVFEALSKVKEHGAGDRPEPKRCLNIGFFSRPLRFLGSHDEAVKAVELEHVMWEEEDEKRDSHAPRRLRPTGLISELPCDLVIKSIGYSALPVEGAPFEERSGLVKHDGTGRAQIPTSTLGGLYCCGWLKRGPSGIIGTNMQCADDTVASIVEDLKQGPRPCIENIELADVLEGRSVEIVSKYGWRQIDGKEVSEGSRRRKPREKLTSVKEMLSISAG